MSKPTPTKSKPPPWIPPGKGTLQYKKHTKTVIIAKGKKDGHVPTEVSPEILPQWNTVDVSKTETKLTDTDMMSLSSHSSYEFERLNQEKELNVHLVSLLQEMKLLYVHFASLKTSYLSAHRLIDYQGIEDSSINELLTEAGSFLKTLNALFDDLEYSVSVLENTLNENQRNVEFSTVLRIKEKLLSTLFAMYEKIILIFQTIFEKQDFKEFSRVQESLTEKLKKTEKKCLSQETIITDLERKLSIYQSKFAAMESYKINLESAKVELEKKLLQKESQIKYLNNELMNASEKYTKSDREDFIEIIEDIKRKAHNEKSALKKALKFLKAQSKEKEETYKKLLEETAEKEKMLFDLATQRDQLKVQLTVVNNNLIQLKQQIEEMKIQNLKLQNQMAEKDTSHKKEIFELKSTIEEKSAELDESLKKKKRLEEAVKELENDLKISKEDFEALKHKSMISKQLNSHTSEKNDMYEEIPRLVALLQSTRETFENFIHSDHHMSASGDHITEHTDFNSNQKEILVAVNEVKEYILELRSQLLTFFHNQKDLTEPKSPRKYDNLEKQFKEVERMYKSAVKENESLRQKLDGLRSSNLTASTAQNTGNYFPTDTSSDKLAGQFQFELCKKDKEIASLKFELAQREKDLESQLRESKDKLRMLEIDNIKLPYLEEELKKTKLELSLLQKKKEEEESSLLRRAEELQESLDNKTVECENLNKHIEWLKKSYYKVFETS